jgi:hypothetical protein
LSAGGEISRIIGSPAGTTTSSFSEGTACEGQLAGSDHLCDGAGGGGGGAVGREVSELHDPRIATGSAIETRRRTTDVFGGIEHPLVGWRSGIADAALQELKDWNY